MTTRSQPSRFSRKWPVKMGFMLLTALWMILTLDILWLVITSRYNSPTDKKLPGPGGTNYLIIAPQALRESASAWADYRRNTGYQTQVALLSSSQAKVEGIRELIQKTYDESERPYPFYVLLMGHAHRFSSHPNTYLPAAHFTVDGTRASSYGSEPIASDDGYTSLDPSGIPDHILPISLGRIPVRSDEEGLRLLERTKVYEEAPPTGEGRARIELVTSNAGFGPQYDPIFDWVLRILMQRLLPDEYQWHMLNGNAKSPYNYPNDIFPNEVAKRFDSGALAMVYIGHGQPDMLCCAYSPEAEAGQIMSIEDTDLIQNANASLGIFTACSAGAYGTQGEDLSVIESIYLSTGGPVAAYSSSAWINGTLNGRLVLNIFEALLIDQATTLGDWIGQIEFWSEATSGHTLLTTVLKSLIPRMSGVYQENPLLSPAQARREVDIQHATYNLFGDPALRIAYPHPGMKISPNGFWNPWRDSLAFHGSSELSAGQQVSISLEALPGNAILEEGTLSETIDRYLQANDPVVQKTYAAVENDGNFSGKIDVPYDIPSGKYLLRAVAVAHDETFVSAQAVYIGWPSILGSLHSAIFWWFLVVILLLVRSVIDRQSS